VAEASEVVLTSLPGPSEVEAVALGANGLLSGLSAGEAYLGRGAGISMQMPGRHPGRDARIHASGESACGPSSPGGLDDPPALRLQADRVLEW